LSQDWRSARLRFVEIARLRLAHVGGTKERDYKLVTAPEIPEMDVAFIETMDGEGPQGAKGVGEAPAICVAAAVGNAIYNATGVRITALPFTPENIYRALRSNSQPPTWIEAA
jgi:CO/xanthine dehydrogenase Mo-binding subunit